MRPILRRKARRIQHLEAKLEAEKSVELALVARVRELERQLTLVRAALERELRSSGGRRFEPNSDVARLREGIRAPGN